MPLINKMFLSLTVILLMAAFVSCLGGGGDPRCKAEIVAGGKTYGAGMDDKPEQALQNGCNKYCLDADPECETMYQIWKSSPKGKPGVTKMQSMYEDSRILDCVTITCANKCVAAVKAGTLTANQSCK